MATATTRPPSPHSLDRATDFHILDEFLPYYALADAFVGDAKRVETYISRLNEQQADKLASKPQELGSHFYIHLAEAALAGDHSNAIRSLQLAKADQMETEHRSIYSRYLIMEIGRILHRETDDERYREFVRDFAQRSTVIEPYMAYTHSFVAMLSEERDERIESLARVLILDPQSRSIARPNDGELAEAREIARRGYPMPQNRIESETVAAIGSR